MYKDILDTTIGSEDLHEVDAGLDTLEQKLALVLLSIPPDETKHLAKIGYKTETFARRALEIGKQNLDLLPRGLDIDRIERDLAAREQIALRFNRIKQLHTKMQSTMRILGSDFYRAGLSIYRSLKANGREAGLTELLAELGLTFEAQGQRKKKPKAPESPTSFEI